MNKSKKQNIKKRCLFVYTSNGSFVKNDKRFLEKYLKVYSYLFKVNKSPHKLFRNLFIFFLKIPFLTFKTDIIFTWFTDYHSPILYFWSLIFKKPVFTVIGGHEVEYLPHLNYGGLKNPIRKYCIKYSLNRAKKILAVSEYTYKNTKKLINHDRIELIYNGFNISEFHEEKNVKASFEKKYFVTAGGFRYDKIMKRKGLDKFFKLAEQLKNEKFIAMGVSKNVKSSVLDNIPENVELKPFVPKVILKNFYKSCKYYVQLSELETFGLAVLEALNFGAIPIISNKGALVEVFGNCSIVIDTDNFEEELKNIKSKIASFKFNKNEHNKLLKKFDINKRYEKLYKLLENYINK